MLIVSKDDLSKIEKSKIEKVELKIAEHKHLTLQDDKFIICPFKSFDEFVEEGIALKNAIASYALNRYGNDEDILLVLRKSNEPDKPYADIEFDLDGNLRQLRIERCLPLTECDAVAFVIRFKNEVLIPYLNKKSINK